MKLVVAAAFRRVLASLVLCLGLLWVVFIGLASTRGFQVLAHCGPRGCPAVPLYSFSSWDTAIAIGIAAASVLAAALIYPRRRPRTPPLPVPTSPR